MPRGAPLISHSAVKLLLSTTSSFASAFRDGQIGRTVAIFTGKWMPNSTAGGALR